MTFSRLTSRIRTTRRGLWAAALVVLVLVGGVLVLRSGGTAGPGAEASASPGTSASAAVAAPSLSNQPRTTPPGTPAPVPDVAIATSASIEVPTPAPNATPTAAPEPGLWRIDGYVVEDGSGKPLAGVCVVIGPRGCQPFSPHTDDRGYWWIDIAEGHATFDFYFEMPGHKTVWLHVTPEGPTVYNVVLTNG